MTGSITNAAAIPLFASIFLLALVAKLRKFFKTYESLNIGTPKSIFAAIGFKYQNLCITLTTKTSA